MSELASEAVSWLWPGRLALGKLAMLDGDPGLGKSLLALDLCARLSTGRPMPDGGPGPEIASALVLEAEDGPRDTVRPRLEALGANLDRVYVMRRGELGELPRLPGQTGTLGVALAESGARLLVLDPLMAFLESGVFVSSDQGVRRALLPLVHLAESHGCAVLLVRHLNKTSGRRALYRGGGSIGLLGACRSGWLVADDPDVAGRRVLAQVKNNLGPPQPSLAFEVRPREGAPPELIWLGASMRGADELVGRAAEAPAAGLPRDRAVEFLKEYLAGGPQTTRAVWEAGVRAGLTKRTLQRAKEELSVRCEWIHEDKAPRAYWLLPLQKLARPGEDDPNSLESHLRRLREQYPGPTPLDEERD